MTMTFTSRIPARAFGFASKQTVPGLEPVTQPVAAPAVLSAVDPDHVFDENFLRDLTLWWTSDDTRTPLYIAGPTGCGKTTTVLQFLARVNMPAVSVTCSRRFVKDDLVGRWGAAASGFAWFDGPATLAWKTGSVLLINEFSLAPAEVWVGANDIFEGQPITIEKTGTSVPRHPNTRVIITDNCRCGAAPETRYGSRNRQDASTCDRFWHMQADWPTKALEKRIAANRCRRAYGLLLRDEVIDEIADCAASFARATRRTTDKENEYCAEDAIPPVSTRVVLRMTEIFCRLLSSGVSGEEALTRAVTLAAAGALSNAQCLAMTELAVYHFAMLVQKLPAGAARREDAPAPEAVFC